MPNWVLTVRQGDVSAPVRVEVHHDRENGSYWVSSPDLDGLVVTGGTLDELKKETFAACGALLALSPR
ncbi:MAG: hypothetical protein IJM64_00105 [Ottowia sp.]|nr:hypothetical protein [Ottowia sp.]